MCPSTVKEERVESGASREEEAIGKTRGKGLGGREKRSDRQTETDASDGAMDRHKAQSNWQGTVDDYSQEERRFWKTERQIHRPTQTERQTVVGRETEIETDRSLNSRSSKSQTQIIKTETKRTT